MSYRTILLSLNEINRTDALLDAAAQLADVHGSHVLGVYVIPAPMVIAGGGPYSGAEVIETFTSYFEEHAKPTRTKFEDVMVRNDIAFEWRVVRSHVSTISQVICDEGRAADLVMVSEIDPNATFGIESGFVEDVVLGSGRPVLVLPRTAGAARLDEIICGYNGSKEAARAIHDALPLLKAAENVRLVWVNPTLDETRGDMAAADMAACLSRHGVHATLDPLPTNMENPFDALSARAKDVGANAIVMGAYGHSRLREFVLGGATRQALATMSLPVVMSH
jgi:nucleotide-binding universal stress UspA family protein